MISAVGWAGFIKPSIGDQIDTAVGQTVKLFTQPTARCFELVVFVGHVAKPRDNLDMQRPMSGSTVGWAGFVKPNIGDQIGADVGQTMKLFTQPTAALRAWEVNVASGLPIEPKVLGTPRRL